jgi:hypothetical protein
MKTFIAVILVSLALSFAPRAFTQQQSNVGVQSTQSQAGNAATFTVYNNTNGTVCLFPYVESSDNVYGSVVPMIQLQSGETGIGIGSYHQADPNYAWSIEIGSKWREGSCA